MNKQVGGLSIATWIGLGISIASIAAGGIGIAAAGATRTAIGALAIDALSLTADGLAIGLQNTTPQTAQALTYTSIALGIIGMSAGIASGLLGKRATITQRGNLAESSASISNTVPSPVVGSKSERNRPPERYVYMSKTDALDAMGANHFQRRNWEREYLGQFPVYTKAEVWRLDRLADAQLPSYNDKLLIKLTRLDGKISWAPVSRELDPHYTISRVWKIVGLPGSSPTTNLSNLETRTFLTADIYCYIRK